MDQATSQYEKHTRKPWLGMPLRQGQSLLLALLTLLVLAVFPFSPAASLGLTALLLCGMIATRQVDKLMIATFALLPFQQSIVGESSPLNICLSDLVMVLLLMAAPFLWMRRGKVVCGPVTAPLLIFLLVVTVSAAMIWHGAYTAMSLVRFFRGTAAAILIFANADLRLMTARRCYTAFLVGINVLSICSLYAFATGGAAASMYTLQIHKNALGPTFGCGVAICVAWWLTSPPQGRLRTWLLLTLLGATVGLVLTLSRGGWISTGVGVVFLLLATRQFRLFIAGMVVLIPMIAALWALLPQSARDYATDVRSESENVHLRLVAIDKTMQAFEASPIYGQGIDFAYSIDPHNVIVLTLAETGVLGLAAFLALFVGGFATFRAAARYARADTEAMQVVLMGAAVLLISLVAATMDVYWRRGVGFMSWCGVGLAVVVIRLGQAGLLQSGDGGRLDEVSAQRSPRIAADGTDEGMAM